MFYDIVEEEEEIGRKVFLDYKNKKLKKSKSWDFSKGVSPWFWSKIGILCRFYSRENKK